jgi:hypothetical protein
MSNMGPEELLVWLLGVALLVYIGYWCMTIFRGKGRSAGAGFALGFFLTPFFSLLGALAAVVITYTRANHLRLPPTGRRPKT